MPVLQEPAELGQPVLVLRQLGHERLAARIGQDAEEIEGDEHQAQDDERGRRLGTAAPGQPGQGGVDDVGEEDGEDEGDEHGAGQLQHDAGDEEDDEAERRLEVFVVVQVPDASSGLSEAHFALPRADRDAARDPKSFCPAASRLTGTRMAPQRTLPTRPMKTVWP